MDVAVSGGRNVTFSHIVSLVSEMKHRRAFDHEPDVPGAYVVVGGRRISRLVTNEVGLDVGPTEKLLGDEIDAISTITSRAQPGKIFEPDY